MLAYTMNSSRPGWLGATCSEIDDDVAASRACIACRRLPLSKPVRC